MQLRATVSAPPGERSDVRTKRPIRSGRALEKVGQLPVQAGGWQKLNRVNILLLEAEPLIIPGCERRGAGLPNLPRVRLESLHPETVYSFF